MAEAKIRIGAEHRQLDSAIGRIQARFRGLASSLSRAITSPLAALGMGLSFAGAIRQVNQLRAALDDVGKGAQRLSVTNAEFQELQWSARRSGQEAKSVETAFRTLSAKIFDAAQGMESARRELAALGLTLADLEGKSRLDQFRLVARAITEVGDAAQQAALANRMFGRGGQDLLPMLRSMDGLASDWKNLNAVIGDDSVDAAQRLTDAMTDLQTVIRALVADSGLIPWLTGIAGAVGEIHAASGKLKTQEATVRGGGVGVGPEQINAKGLLLGGGPLGWLARFLAEEAGERTGLLRPTLRVEGATRQDVEDARAAREDRMGGRDKRANLAAETAKQESLAAAAAEEAKVREAEQALAERQLRILEEQLGTMQDAVAVQNLLNQGREREAFIMEKLIALRRRLGRELDEGERGEIERGAGALFDVQQEDAAKRRAGFIAEKMVEAEALARARGEALAPQEQVRVRDAAGALFDAEQRDAMRPQWQRQIFAGGIAGIGGGGARALDIATPQLDQERNRILGQMNGVLQDIRAGLPGINERRFA